MSKKHMYVLLCVLAGMLLLACGTVEQTAGQPFHETAASSNGQPEETVRRKDETADSTDHSEQSPIGETPDTSEKDVGPLWDDVAGENTEEDEEATEMKMTVQIGEYTFTATLEDNDAVEALVERISEGPVTIQMRDYAGFEKVGDLGTSLPASNRQITTQAGDIVLYQGSQVVIFYGSNSWSYTRLGRIDDLTGWAEALGGGDVAVTFSLEM